MLICVVLGRKSIMKGKVPWVYEGELYEGMAYGRGRCTRQGDFCGGIFINDKLHGYGILEMLV